MEVWKQVKISLTPALPIAISASISGNGAKSRRDHSSASASQRAFRESAWTCILASGVAVPCCCCCLCTPHKAKQRARSLRRWGCRADVHDYATSGPSNGIVVSLVLFTLDRISPALRLSGAPGETLRCAPCRVKSCFAVCAPPLDEHGVSGR